MDMIVSQILVKGDSISMSQMGQSIPVETNEMKLALKESAVMFPELESYSKFTANLAPTIQLVDDKEAYEITIVTEAGSEVKEYFDVASGLKVKQVSSMKTEGNNIVSTILLDDYREVNGIKFPYVQKVNNGPMEIELKVEDIKVNSGLMASDFK